MRVSSNTNQIDSVRGNISPMADDFPGAVDLPERHRVDAAKNRRQLDVDRKQSMQSMGKMLGDLSDVVNDMRNPSSFQNMLVESSHGDILTGEITGPANAGTYEFEVNSLARPSRILAHAFPDKDKTPVGFGFLSVNLNGKDHNVEIEPGSRLIDVAEAINSSVSDVKASIVNTGQKDDPFTLMVTSLTSGVQASIKMDPDTTFLDVARTMEGRDLEMSFEGIAIQRPVNGVADLIDGVSLRGISAAPGVAVSLEVKPDKEQASDRVRSFVQQYNGIQAFGREQLSKRIGESGTVAGDSSMRQVTSALQSVMQEGNLFNFGITTDPKTGQLQLDESKLSMALNNNYDQVVGLFVSNGGNSGLAEKMQSVIKGLQSKSSGALGQRIQGLEQRIRKQDDDIARKEQQLQDKTDQLKKKMSLINSRMSAINAEDAQLTQRLTP